MIAIQVLIYAQKPDLAIKTCEIQACRVATQRLNRCLEAIYERWLINARKMKWEMKRCLLRLMKGELVGGHFVQLSISNLNHLNTADIKGKNGKTVTYCGFIPLMSSTTTTPLWLYGTFNVWTVCWVNAAFIRGFDLSAAMRLADFFSTEYSTVCCSCADEYADTTCR